MKKTTQEKKEMRIRIIIDIVVLLFAALLTYQFVVKEYIHEYMMMQNSEVVEQMGDNAL